VTLTPIAQRLFRWRIGIPARLTAIEAALAASRLERGLAQRAGDDRVPLQLAILPGVRTVGSVAFILNGGLQCRLRPGAVEILQSVKLAVRAARIGRPGPRRARAHVRPDGIHVDVHHAVAPAGDLDPVRRVRRRARQQQRRRSMPCPPHHAVPPYPDPSGTRLTPCDADASLCSRIDRGLTSHAPELSRGKIYCRIAPLSGTEQWTPGSLSFAKKVAAAIVTYREWPGARSS